MQPQGHDTFTLVYCHAYPTQRLRVKYGDRRAPRAGLLTPLQRAIIMAHGSSLRTIRAPRP